MVIAHNMSAMNAQRQFNIVSDSKAKSIEKLSSGYRINRAADDAAGLAISEKMRRQIRGLTRASENCQDGVSFVQVADGALNEVTEMLQRVNELAIQAANGTNSHSDREAIDDEVQQLKKEMKRVFNTTSFNEKEIFLAPCLPEVSRTRNTELNFQLYNSDSSGNVGGVRVDNVRYSWAELGLDKIIDSDNRFIDSGVVNKRLSSGEVLELKYEKGKTLNDITRIYRWKADDEGIVINDNTLNKVSWNSIGISGNQVNSGIYTLSHDGMDISFEVSETTNLEELKKRINGDELSETTWETVPLSVIREQAVKMYYNPNITFTAENQKYLLENKLELVATEDGVGFSSKKYKDYTFVKWESFTDKNSGNYAITDWGLSSETCDDMTFDDDAVYVYKDNKTGITIEFSLADEASKEAVIRGLSLMLYPSITAHSDDTIGFIGNWDVDLSSLAKSITSKKGSSAITISDTDITDRMQQVIGRDFSVDTFFNVNLNMDQDASGDYSLNYYLHGNSTAAYSAQTALYAPSGLADTNAFLQNAVKGNNPSSLMLLLKNEAELKKAFKEEFLTMADSYVRIDVDFGSLRQAYKDSLTERKSIYESDINNLMKNGYSDSEADRLKKEYENDLSIIDDKYIEAAASALKNTGTNDLNGKIKAEKASAYLYGTHSLGYSYAQQYSFKVNAPDKVLGIQAGCDSDNMLEIKWKPLSLSTIGISDINTLTQNEALSAITQTSNAINGISAERSKFGAYQNRMEHTIKNLDNVVENSTAAESRIRDIDFAKESVSDKKSSILMQTVQAMLTQANHTPENVLNMLT